MIDCPTSHPPIMAQHTTTCRTHACAGFIAFQQLVRRTQGKEAARKVFSSTKALRRKGALSYHVRCDWVVVCWWGRANGWVDGWVGC